MTVFTDKEIATLLWIKLPSDLKKEIYLERLELALYRLLFVEEPIYVLDMIEPLKKRVLLLELT